jgi:integrase
MPNDVTKTLADFSLNEQVNWAVVTANVRIDHTGATLKLPALLTNRGVVAPLIDFCAFYSEGRSLDWMQKLCRACGLFLDFAAANRGMSDRAILESFAVRLFTGTFDSVTGIDPSELCWRPVGRPTARRVLSQLKTFFGKFDEMRQQMRAWQAPYDKAVEHAAFMHARDSAFLGHTWGNASSRASIGALVSTAMPRSPHVQDGEPPAFPEERFMEFLLKGWRIGGRYSHRDMLIVLLLNGAGVRLSELFHLYVSDIFPDPLRPDSAAVLFHHPLDGAAPEDWVDAMGAFRTGTRRAYLNERWGMEPRNRIRGAKHAGWKGAALTKEHGSLFFRAQWFVPQLGEIFMLIWNRYLAGLVYLERKHPYAFVNMLRGEKGAEFKKAAFNAAHAQAVRRIGMEPSRVDGTTPHGHRHAYGRRLARADVPGADIQRFMHHCSYESHLVYTRPYQKEVIQTLSAAAERQANTPSARKWESFVNEVQYQLRCE